MDYLKNVFGKKQIKFLIISGISLCAGFLVLLIGFKLSKSLKAENMAKRWGDDREFTQVSVFFSDLAEYNEDRIRQLIFASESKFKEDSIAAKGEERLWVYAYSSTGKTIISSKTASLSVKTIGVGGDFFLFHPVKLISGSTFGSENLNDDLVVIDRDISFSLFGSTDVVGQIVEINGHSFVVCGVIDRDEGRLNRLAGNDAPILYMSYSAATDDDININMYEALMPNPITGYAEDIIKSNVGVDERYYEIVENTGRFHFTRLLKLSTEFGTRSMNSKGIVYPYWENMARGMEDYLIPLAVLGLILFMVPAACIIYTVGRLWKLRPVHMADIKDALERLAEKSREKRTRKKADRDNSHKPKKEKIKKEKPSKKKKGKRGDIKDEESR